MKNILVSITGRTPQEWQQKLGEIEELQLFEVALFLELYDFAQKQEIYNALLKSCVKSIPLVHIRHDMAEEELVLLQKNFGTKYFTCHEENFVNHDIDRWKNFHKDIYLEMNFDNVVSKETQVEKIGGFCIDLAHFKVAMEKQSREFDYVFERKDKNLFPCNHIGGWNREKNIDMHTVFDMKKDFEYITSLPSFVFGDTLAIELFNPIYQQLEFKTHLEKLFAKKFV